MKNSNLTCNSVFLINLCLFVVPFVSCSSIKPEALPNYKNREIQLLDLNNDGINDLKMILYKRRGKLILTEFVFLESGNSIKRYSITSELIIKEYKNDDGNTVMVIYGNKKNDIEFFIRDKNGSIYPVSDKEYEKLKKEYQRGEYEKKILF